ncbi:class I SAM-dependent methyltransferase [Actinoplanes sp. N902-109]|uniref:class I SAM-dependent methyltransferase n=1 Tax=Actinoplanes sp. (strain N902-109) TaxID=649831 RepID=UPI0003295B5E|nr:class I SAM-dependent methyltransferase [Actinoplanes sp. N902-109]AGL18796.1 hypothetical protein L083_5286 [Actinoplanes sp. N902-109]
MTEASPEGEAILDAARAALRSYNLTVTGTDSEVVRLPEGAAADLVRLLTRSARRIDQIVPSFGWADADLFMLMAWRQEALRGTEVNRLYVVPFGNPDMTPINREKALDHDGGIDAHVAHLGMTPAVPVPMTHTWLIDDHAVVFEEHGDSGPAGWVVSRRPYDVKVARQRWTYLWERRFELANQPPHLAEPLLESADILHSLAQVACTRHHVHPVSCAWYHGIWQYLRLYDMVSSPIWHSDFYSAALREHLHSTPQARVLITGAADYGTLAYVLNAVERPAALDVQVLDMCMTPLLANRWFARRRGTRVRMHNLDFVEAGERFAAEQQPFDLIISDAFLTRFSAADAAVVAQNWRRLLKPGGRLITTVRLYESSRQEPRAADITEYGLRLYERAKNSSWLLKIDFNDLLKGAHDYAVTMSSSDQLGGADQVAAFFTRHGFDIVQRESAAVAGELTECNYLRIVCSV